MWFARARNKQELKDRAERKRKSNNKNIERKRKSRNKKKKKRFAESPIGLDFKQKCDINQFEKIRINNKYRLRFDARFDYDADWQQESFGCLFFCLHFSRLLIDSNWFYLIMGKQVYETSALFNPFVSNPQFKLEALDKHRFFFGWVEIVSRANFSTCFFVRKTF